MTTVYVDSGAFIALVWRRDQAHERVTSQYRRYRSQRARFVTSDPVVGETATRLRYDDGLPAALAFRDVVREAVSAGDLRVRESDQPLRNAAFDVMRRYGDLPLSYADGVGAAVTREVKAAAVFGLDHHFRLMGFTLEPGP